MKRTVHAIAGLAAVTWLASCGGGTLGGNGGMIGTLTGAAGVTSPGLGNGGAGAGPAGAAGFGGDIAAPGGRGGKGGQGGRGGVSGPGGEFGIGGTFGPGCLPPNPPYCGSLCGNGRIDQCSRVTPPGCPSVIDREWCDGDDFGGDSCVARGWGSGELACGGDCTFAPDTCSPCLPPGPLVASCGPAPSTTPQYAQYAIAATDSEVGLVLIDYETASGIPAMRFDRLSAALDLSSTTGLDDASPPASGFAVAPLPSGWVVASCDYTDVHLLPLNAAGEQTGRTAVADVGGAYGCTSWPVLVARPGGGPLLLWQTETGLQMSLIAADGLSASAPRLLVGRDAVEWESVSGAWVGSEFAVAVPIHVDPTSGVRALRLLRVLPDGTAGLVGDFLTGEFDGQSSMAFGPDARDVRVVYNGVPPGVPRAYEFVVWWRYDSSAPARATALGGIESYFGRAPAVAFGDDTIVLLTPGYANRLSVARVASDGTIVGPIREVAKAFASNIALPDMVRRGPEVVVSYVGPGGQLILARLTP